MTGSSGRRRPGPSSRRDIGPGDRLFAAPQAVAGPVLRVGQGRDVAELGAVVPHDLAPAEAVIAAAL